MKNTNKALFLDRDGVVNVDHGYVYQPEKFEFFPGVFAACKAFFDAGFKLIIVTNQSGIGRGYYTQSDFHRLTQWMNNEFAKNAVHVTDVYFCPHHPKKALPEYLTQCDCRKPAPGMLNQAMKEHNINPALSIMVGDKLSDMQAASAANVATRVLVRSGQSVDNEAMATADYIFDSLADLPAILHR